MNRVPVYAFAALLLAVVGILIVPLTGDFGGPKAIRAVGQYASDHGATVTAFYLSNVEQYLFQGNGNQNGGWKSFYANVSMLPLDATSTFIRSRGGGGRGGGILAGCPDVRRRARPLLGSRSRHGSHL